MTATQLASCDSRFCKRFAKRSLLLVTLVLLAFGATEPPAAWSYNVNGGQYGSYGPSEVTCQPLAHRMHVEFNVHNNPAYASQYVGIQLEVFRASFNANDWTQVQSLSVGIFNPGAPLGNGWYQYPRFFPLAVDLTTAAPGRYYIYTLYQWWGGASVVGGAIVSTDHYNNTLLFGAANPGTNFCWAY